MNFVSLLIAGASVRAAAASARRSDPQLEIRACDLFADDDLSDLARSDRLSIGDYPARFVPWALSAPRGRWMYTGGLENYPDIIAEISEFHELVGCSAECVGGVRDPRRLHRRLAEQGFYTPKIADPSPFAAATELLSATAWLAKPFKSCGGLGIRRIAGGQVPPPTDDRSYYQELIAGEPHAGLFMATDGGCQLLGVTRSFHVSQVPTEKGLPPAAKGEIREFAYLGSVGPLRLTAPETHRWQQLGIFLAGEFGLRGIFGVDTIVVEQTPYVLEVNPRFTASMELLDLAGLNSVVGLHLRCFSHPHGPLPAADHFASPALTRCGGKAVIYPSVDIEFTTHLYTAIRDQVKGAGASCADIPPLGTHVPAGHPLLTILFVGENQHMVGHSLGFFGEGLLQNVGRLCRAYGPNVSNGLS